MTIEELARDVKDLWALVREQQRECYEHKAVVTAKRLDDLEDDVTALSASMAIAKLKWGAVQFVGQFLGTIVGGTVVGIVVWKMRGG